MSRLTRLEQVQEVSYWLVALAKLLTSNTSLGEMLRADADADQTGCRLGYDSDHRFARRPPRPVASQTHAFRSAGQRTHRRCRHADLDADLRGVRPAQAAEMVGPGAGALLHH